MVLLVLLISLPVQAVDVFLVPDSTYGDAGDTVEITCEIGATELMRGYTVYMAYDTNLIRLVHPALPGSVVADQEGLQFNYFDHIPIFPDRLEIGATVFGDDLWSGPGDIFTARFELLDCGDVPITAPFPPFFVDAENNYPPTTFTGAAVLICGRVPAPVSDLVILPLTTGGVHLWWNPVATDTLGRPLTEPPVYSIFRQQILPDLQPAAFLNAVSDTEYFDSYSTGSMYQYYIVVEGGSLSIDRYPGPEIGEGR